MSLPWIIILILSVFIIASPAYSKTQFLCKTGDPKHCVCTETINPASVLGYNSTEDRQSVMVDITCIDMKTMGATYYTVRKENGLGASYTGIAVPHEGF